MTDQPDLFDLVEPVAVVAAPSAALPRPSVQVLPFPLAARTIKIRDVARKLHSTKTARHGDSYRAQVTEALRTHLRSKQVPAELHDREIGAFWRAVAVELARLGPIQHQPRGMA